MLMNERMNCMHDFLIMRKKCSSESGKERERRSFCRLGSVICQNELHYFLFFGN